VTADQEIAHRFSIDLAKNRELLLRPLFISEFCNDPPDSRARSFNSSQSGDNYWAQPAPYPTKPCCRRMEPPHFLGQRASIRSGHARHLAEKSDDPTQVTYVRDSRTVTVLRKQIFIQAAGANIIVVPVPLRAYTAICKGSKKLFERK